MTDERINVIGERTGIHTNRTGTSYATKWYDMTGLTMQKMFRLNVERYRDQNFLGYRPLIPNSTKRGEYKYFKFGEVGEMVSDFASGLRTLDLNIQDKVGIMAKNCVQWGLVDYSAFCQSLILVPVYDSYGPSECSQIIKHSEITTIFCTEDKLNFICSTINPQEPQLKHIVIMSETCNPLNSKNWSSISEKYPDVKIHTFDEVMETGKANRIPDVIAEPDTLLTIVYTSGTTGTPKGAMITHNNCVAAACQIHTRIPPAVPGLQESMISYLPLAHILEKVLEYMTAAVGGVVGYYSGSMDGLSEDIGLLRPTLWPGVPRVFTKIYTKIQSLVAKQPWYKKMVFNFAYNMKLRNLRMCRQTPWADVLVFNTMKNVMGGRVRMICNGAAALPFYIAEFISVVFGNILGEGYALTETCASICAGEANAFDPNSVGHPYINSEICLTSIPDMGYLVNDKPYPRGEILVRGPQIFKGYFKDPAATAAAFDPDGFFHTGDVGTWMPGPYVSDGVPCESLHIIDRKKNIFKLSQGEFICAEKVEAVILQHCRVVKQLIVHGQSTASCLVAIVVPDWDYLLEQENQLLTQADVWGGELVRKYWEGEIFSSEKDADPLAYSRRRSSSSRERSSNSSINEGNESTDAKRERETQAKRGRREVDVLLPEKEGRGRGSESSSTTNTNTSIMSLTSFSLSSLSVPDPSSPSPPPAPCGSASSPYPPSSLSSSFSSSSSSSSYSSSSSSFSSSINTIPSPILDSSSYSPPKAIPTIQDIHTPVALCRLLAEGKTTLAAALFGNATSSSSTSSYSTSLSSSTPSSASSAFSSSSSSSSSGSSSSSPESVILGGTPAPADSSGGIAGVLASAAATLRSIPLPFLGSQDATQPPADVCAGGGGGGESVPVNSVLKKYLLQEIRKVCEAHSDLIKRFEIPRGVVVCAEEWTDANGYLTATLKTKRDVVRRQFRVEYQEELARVEKEKSERDKKDH